MKTHYCCLTLGVAILLLAHAAYAATQRYALQLNGDAPYYSVTLTAPVYAASQRGDLGDVRVFNGAGEPVPYSLEADQARAVALPTLQAVRWFPLPAVSSGAQAGAPLGVTIAADGSLHATASNVPKAQQDTDLVDTGDRHVGALRVHLRNDNYQGAVEVEASADLTHWQPLTSSQLLKASYNGQSLGQERIALDDLRVRYLRLHWLDAAPDIASIEAEVLADAPAAHAGPRQWQEHIAARAGQAAGEYLFDTAGAYPVDRVRLDLPQINTVAPATIYSRSDAQQPWREVSPVMLYRLRQKGSEQHNPPLEIAPNTDKQWRVLVDPRNGGLGAGALMVAVAWQPATLTFVARGNPPFTLAAGHPGWASQAVGRAELMVGTASAAAASVGTVLPPMADEADPASVDPDARRRYVLWGALILAVAVLGGMAWKVLRHPASPG